MYKKRAAKSIGSKWSKEEEELVHKYNDSVIDFQQLSAALENRTPVAIRNKIRKLRIADDIFGNQYREKKEAFTQEIARNTKPKRVFEAYAGAGNQTLKWIEVADVVYSSERNKQKYDMLRNNLVNNGWEFIGIEMNNWELFLKGKKKILIVNEDAITASTYFHPNNIRISLIDLDTCGSTILTVPTFLNNVRPNYMVITFGEYHSYRMKRYDVIHRILPHIDLTSNLEFNHNEFLKEIQKALISVTFRAHNEISKSFFPKHLSSTVLDGGANKLVRTLYKVEKPTSNADVLNLLLNM